MPCLGMPSLVFFQIKGLENSQKTLSKEPEIA